MKTTTFLNLMFAMAISILLYSCKGDTGPAGPAGANGVANISSSSTLLSPSNWFIDPNDAYQIDAIINDGSITSSVISGGSVQIFVSSDNVNWAALPFTAEVNTVDYSFNYFVAAGSVEVYIQNITPGNLTVPNAPTGDYIKIVIIPPAAMKKHPNTNWHDYSQVNAILETQKVTQNN